MAACVRDLTGERHADPGRSGRQQLRCRAFPQQRIEDMNTYVIRRKAAWASPAELEQVAGRSKEVADSEFPEDIRWIRSYVTAEEDGSLGTVCIYQASGEAAIRKHAQRVGMPADEIIDVADTVVIRPDPVREPSAS
jgi:hypothetical protein